MRLDGRRKSQNVEERRRSAAPAAVGGGIGVLVLAVIVMLLGGNPANLLQQLQAPPQAAAPGGVAADQPLSVKEQAAREFSKKILASTEDVWTEVFAKSGQRYQPTTMVLFSGTTSSGCGHASSASGPFYCPADGKVYLDTSFFEQMAEQLGAPGDFAQAYVIAHEVGHHIQNLTGRTDWMDQQRQQLSETEYNRLSVRLELQADYYAGVWAHYEDKMFGSLEPGDIREGLNAANAIGDDRLQKQTQGYVVPDSFTHGTSDQRLRWFYKGYETGDLSQSDTFEMPYERL